ncbi:glycoside hydrolase family 2 TIM barrel-domain containing protein [Paenibacillus sp. JX-17]|uniref:Glycoside hydrolase family 2 TIM barrel-domain containing protein n=1 Tax=Paenibacillus lacisoli TaxID=3064525 RepID=A0ABT9C7U2_9BACL|nr:glycoside hydrolase family 2 TIM barrel-domain containing protein [Paenibacillus sp. JX-17]MDO7905316.1 glycoside hydrolase family 2 TIM barrel-domain containing protein [Paenibacillus sp. JX-17]
MKNRQTAFNGNWYFTKQPLHATLADAAASRSWMPVTLPHDWLIYDTKQLYENGEGWYRKQFTLPEFDEDTLYSLRFEGVYMNATLYVNNQIAGEWKYGYSTFEFDITPYVTPGENTIYVRVIHESPNSRWYSGAGIYRSVWLKTYTKSHVAADGIYISAAQQDHDIWNVDAATELVLDARDAGSVFTLRHTIRDPHGEVVLQDLVSVESLNSNPSLVVDCRLPVTQPLLWDLNHPYLYTLQTELLRNHEVLGEERQHFGFRRVHLDSQQGFFLNGRHLKLYGVCQHHDLGCLGAAVNRTALKRQIRLLQEMGVNAIRTAHNMPAVELMELADEMGVLIVSEAFDMWERSKTPYDYARFFPEWWRRDIASWVRRDRNHPSLIMWSIGNEIYDTHADERGQEVTKALMDEVLIHDPKSNAFVTIGSNYMPWENAQKCADIVKVAGYNYGEKYYDQQHAEHPDWIIYGSETASTVQSRGIYHFPLAQPVLADDDEQCSALGNSSTSWGAKSTEACIISDRDAAYSLGQFIWTGFDYIGEPTPYFTKNSYFGQLDTAGFPKDSYYIYQAEWTDYRTHPMVHVFPYWDFSEGQLIDVRVCSNAPRVELFFNGLSQGTCEIDHAHGSKLLGEWQLPYMSGELHAIAYDEHGQIVAEERRSSFSDAAALVLEPDRYEMSADGQDLIFVTVSAVDSEGRPVENANNRVHFTVEGPGRLVGLDNGDSTDYDPYKGTNRRMFSGRLLAVIAGTLEPGRITLHASSPGITPSVLQLDAREIAPAAPGEERCLYADNPLEAKAQNAKDSENVEIPVRKLEIICPEGQILTPDQASLPVRVQLHPAGSTYQNVQWRITNAAGVDTNIASIRTDGQQAVVTGLGDGTVYIRCGTTNGADGIRLYSQLELTLTGFGQAHLDPYEFVSAAYHSSASTNLTNGNERGVATAREGESLIVFERVDLGSYGADEIILPIFSLDGEAFPLEIWKGIPHQAEAELLTTVTYQKPSRWNVYQEETYQLPQRLTGLTTLSFLLRRKIHLKGFQFKRRHKAYELLAALDSSKIYGDTFTRTATAIESIGNNVSLIFEDMDFGQETCSRIRICGRTSLDKNTIQILFSSPDGETRQLIEFEGSDRYNEQEFPLEPVSGRQTVTFLFLPGSQFDFRSFQFMSAD